MDSPAQPRPIDESSRIALLDVLRGFALYGVLLANAIPWFAGHAFLSPAQAAAPTSPADSAALALNHVLVAGKAMTLFSFLFGLGFAVQLQRYADKGLNGVALYARRLGILLLIGFAHVVLISSCDILTAYAVVGLALLLFRRSTDRTLIIWAAVLMFVPQLLLEVPRIDARLARLVLPSPPSEAYNAQVLAALAGHDYLHLMRIQLGLHLSFMSLMVLRLFPWTLGRFLLGYLVGRGRYLESPATYLPVMRRLSCWGLFIGLPCAIGAYLIPHRVHGPPPLFLVLIVTTMQEVATLALAGVYLSAIALLLQRPAWQRRLLLLAPMGQTALSNYLSQSLSCAFVFFGWGLGAVGHVGPALCIPITLLIFAVHLIGSRIWLRHFRFGPAEWLWRSLTYGRPQPMRRR